MNLSFTSSKSQLAALPIPTHVILASQSIGRKMLLDKLGIRFRVAVSHVDEEKITASDPYKLIKLRAAAKMEEVVNHPRVYVLDEKVKNLVIAADSMAIVGKKVYGKPTDREDVKRMLKELMGKTHVFATAVAVAFLEPGNKLEKKWEKTLETKVTLGKMSSAELDGYVTRYDFTRFAAGYALNEAPWDIITKIDGSYTNVIGLPFEILLPILRTQEIVI